MTSATKTNSMITTSKLAYKIGFSDSLSLDVISAYQEITKWKFITDTQRKLHRSYYRGFREGYEMRVEVGREMLGRPRTPDTTFVATLRSSEFIN